MKSNMKKVLSVLTAVCMLVAMVPSAAFAFDSGDVFSDTAADFSSADIDQYQETPAAGGSETMKPDGTFEEYEGDNGDGSSDTLNDDEKNSDFSDGAEVFSDNEDLLTASEKSGKPADGTTVGQPFAAGTGGSANFRIPALVTLSDGTLVAAADARWNDTSDGWGLDTIVSRSADGGENWSYTFANYLGDNGNAYNADSTAFIDPALAVAEDGTIYMLVDLYPHGTYIGNVQAGTGFDGNGRLLLSANNRASFDYYLDGNEIKDSNGNAVSGYTVDEYYNIKGEKVDTNLFFSDSPYQVLSTSYLYLTKSTDGGKTWSAPMMLNSQVKNSGDTFYGVGPGRGLVTSTGRIIFPCYTYINAADGNTSVIYSDDGGNTWTRSAGMTSQSSEAALTEADGRIYMFTRHGGYYVSSDNGSTWSDQQSVDIWYTTTCQLSAITYSRKIDGKTAILLSAPTYGRNAGKIFTGLVQEDGSIKWTYTYSVNNSAYAYSCLTELKDGTIGLLYENAGASIAYTHYPISTIAKGAAVDGNEASENVLVDEQTGVKVDFGEKTVESMTVEKETVEALAGQKYVAFNITPADYTGSAKVTIPLSDELKESANLTGFVVESTGEIKEIAGSLNNDGYTFETPHFSVMGVLANEEYGDNNSTVSSKDVTLYVNQSKTETDSTGNYQGSYTGSGLDTNIARVQVEGTTISGGTEKTLGNTVSMNSDGTYTGVISDGNGNYLALNGNSIANTTDINQATEWTVTRETSYYGYGTSYYSISSGNSYLNTNLNVSTHNNGQWRYSDNEGFYYSSWRNTNYLRTNSDKWEVASTNSKNGKLYSVFTSTSKPQDVTNITFTGVSAGSTSVQVGHTVYNITVKEQPPIVNMDTTPFIAKTGVGGGKKITKLTTSVGLTFDIDLNTTGDVKWSVGDSSIATVDAYGRVTGVAAGETTVTATINGVAYTIPVVIRQDTTSSYTKIYDFYLSEVTDTTVYYSVSVSTDLVEAQKGEAIYISCGATEDTAVDFFAKPNEGYALTRMSSTNSAGDYMALNNADPSKTDFYTKSGAAGANQRDAFGDKAVYNMVQAALDKECDGGMGWTRTSDNTSGATSDLTFRSEKLPTVSKSVATVDGKAYSKGMVAHEGEKVVFNVTVTQYAAQDNITYSKAVLKDNLNGATFVGVNSANKTVSGLSNTALTQNKEITYKVEYTIKDDDLDKTITNTVDLNYTYQSQYSSGSFGGTAKADAKFTAASFNPEDIVIDFGLPVEIDYSGKNAHGRYDLESGTATYGKVIVRNNKVTYTPTNVLLEADTVTLTNTEGGTYTFKVYPATTVYYEEGFASYSGNWNVGSKGTGTQKASVVGSKDFYGYDDKYASENAGASNTTAAVTTSRGDSAEFTFRGTGIDIYANCTESTGIVKVKNTKSDQLVQMLYIDTMSGDGKTYATMGQKGTNYNVPIASIAEMPYGTYTVTVSLYQMGERRTEGISLDGFRVYNTLGTTANDVYTEDGEANPKFAELRDYVLGSLTVDTSESIYADQIAKNTLSQVYSLAGKTAGALILSSAEAYNEKELKDLLDNGPKNEVYVLPKQKIVLKLKSTNAQIGLKALNKETSLTVSGITVPSTLSTSTDMFYEITDKNVTIENTGDGILAITKIKFFDGDPSALFADLTEESLMPALLSMGYKQSPAPTATPTPTVEPTKAPVVTAPAAVTLKKLTAAGLTGAKLTWSKVKNADGYLIYRKTGSGSWKKIAAVKSTASSYTDSKLTAGKSYTYTVRAYKKVNGKVYKGDYDKKGLTINLVPETPVLKKLSKASGSSLKLTWGKAANADGYVIYRKVSASNKWEKVATIKKGSTVSYTDKNLKSGKTYTYTVRAYKTVNGKNIYSSYNKNGIKTKLK